MASFLLARHPVPVTTGSTWTTAPGVVEMGDGTLVRGRPLRGAMSHGEQPAFGLYLLAHEPPPMAWEARWVRWPDFRLPHDRADAAAAFLEAHQRAATERVEVACNGGRGRTGTALACIAVLSGVDPEAAVEFIRERYDRHAVETPAQRRFVRQFRRLVRE